MIVLDAVGAGELPDAADYGDEGSNTLANVARAVGGLDLPNLEQLGLGNVEELEGCPPQPQAPAVAGRLLERRRKLSSTRRGTLSARRCDVVIGVPAQITSSGNRYAASGTAATLSCAGVFSVPVWI